MLSSDDIAAIRGRAAEISLRRVLSATSSALLTFLVSLPYMLGLIAGGIWRGIVIVYLAIRKGWWDGSGTPVKPKEPPKTQ